jgi:hypothetical protein
MVSLVEVNYRAASGPKMTEMKNERKGIENREERWALKIDSMIEICSDSRHHKGRSKRLKNKSSSRQLLLCC